MCDLDYVSIISSREFFLSINTLFCCTIEQIFFVEMFTQVV